jgi:hypothetical protein
MAKENQSKPWYKRWWAIVIYFIVGVIILGNLLNSNDVNSTGKFDAKTSVPMLSRILTADECENYPQIASLPNISISSCQLTSEVCECEIDSVRNVENLLIFKTNGSEFSSLWLCKDERRVASPEGCGYSQTAAAYEEVSRTRTANRQIANSEPTNTITNQVPSSPSACKICDVEPMVWDSYDHMYRPGWNQTCYDKIMDCLTGIYRERQNEGVSAPMCDKSGGHDCLCFDGYPESKDYQVGPYQCYAGLAERLCDEELTDELCTAYSTYFPYDAKQECVQRVEQKCNS